MKRHQILTCVLLIGLLLVPLTESELSPASAADFNRDGYADLAIGVGYEAVGTDESAGAVNVLHGTSNGISAVNDQLWVQDDLVTNGSEPGDKFGASLAAGDFNDDGAVDLVVGVSGEGIGLLENAGAVHIMYGTSSQGLVAPGNQYWHQDIPGVEEVAEEGDHFGSQLTVGDFNGDGYDDLVVGVPSESFDIYGWAGAVNVLYGTATGLSALNDQLWYEEYNGLTGGIEAADWFGYALAAGDMNRDGYDDLAISIVGEDLGSIINAGRVVILYGTINGLSSAGHQSWQQGQLGVQDTAEENDYFGESLATGDFDGDGYADLAIGTPNEDWDGTEDVGVVNILFGSSNGLISDGNQLFVGSSKVVDNEFGHALVSGDFNGDGFDELAVGIPFEDLYSWANVGAVEILYGSSGGLNRRRGYDDIWTQNRSGMEDGSEMGDQFGNALAAGDFNSDSYVDLAVGVYREDINLVVDAGAVHILYGSAIGISATGNQFWHQDSPLVGGVAETDDYFGYSLAAIPWTRHWIYLPLVLNNN